MQTRTKYEEKKWLIIYQSVKVLILISTACLAMFAAMNGSGQRKGPKSIAISRIAQKNVHTHPHTLNGQHKTNMKKETTISVKFIWSRLLSIQHPLSFKVTFSQLIHLLWTNPIYAVIGCVKFDMNEIEANIVVAVGLTFYRRRLRSKCIAIVTECPLLRTAVSLCDEKQL